MTILTSSTCCTEHFSMVQAGLFTTALFRNLRLSDGDSNDFDTLLLSTSHSSSESGFGEGLVAILAMAMLELLGMQEFSKEAMRTC